MTHIYVTCATDGDGWRCSVRVGDDAAATTHEVTVSADAKSRYAEPRTDAQSLVHESFVFLLEREPRESILRRFELPTIERYFPEYPTEIRTRLVRRQP
jgi:hypothetical protein